MGRSLPWGGKGDSSRFDQSRPRRTPPQTKTGPGSRRGPSPIRTGSAFRLVDGVADVVPLGGGYPHLVVARLGLVVLELVLAAFGVVGRRIAAGAVPGTLGRRLPGEGDAHARATVPRPALPHVHH